MKNQSRPLHQVQSAAPGNEQQAKVLNKEGMPEPPEMAWVLDAINGVSKIPTLLRASRRLRRILQGLKDLDKILSELARHGDRERQGPSVDWPNYMFRNSHSNNLNLLGQEKMREVNGFLSPYISSPRFMVRSDYKMIQLPDWKTRRNVHDEHFAVEMILEAVRKGALSRYRECAQCRCWFYAATNHQRFCKDSCRKQYASKSDEYRKKRRIYMRRYRKDQSVLDDNAKKFVKR